MANRTKLDLMANGFEPKRATPILNTIQPYSFNLTKHQVTQSAHVSYTFTLLSSTLRCREKNGKLKCMYLMKLALYARTNGKTKDVAFYGAFYAAYMKERPTSVIASVQSRAFLLQPVTSGHVVRANKHK